MRLHGVWVDTVVEKPTIWRCRCGAMLSTQKAMMRHVAGDTMCQHRGEGMVAYVPESPGPEAGSEGAIPKQQAGLHDDELLVEEVASFLLKVDRAASIQLKGPKEYRYIAETLVERVAAVRGAGVQVSDDSLAVARGFTDGEIAALDAVLSLLKIEGPLGEVNWPDFESARTKLKARQSWAESPYGVEVGYDKP